MKFKSTAVLLAILAVLAVGLVPLASEESSAEVNTGDINVTIPGHKITTVMEDGFVKISVSDITVSNAGETELKVLINNKSDGVLSINTVGSTNGDLKVVASSERILLGPSNEGGALDSICIVTITVSADDYAKSQTEMGYATIVLTDLDDNDYLTIEFDLTVDVDSNYYSANAYNKFFGIIPNELPEPLDNVWFTALVTMILWIVASIIVSYIIIPIFTRLIGFKKSSDEKKKLKRTLAKLISLLMFFVALNECAEIVGAGPELIHSLSTISNVFYVIISAIIIWDVYLFVISAFFKGVEDNIDVDGVDTSLIPLFKMLGKLILAVSSVAVILASFGVDLGGILVSAGVVSLGITLGAQNILGQFFSGIVLLSTRPFKKGDYVKINDTVYIVRKVKLMYTEFNNWDKDQIITIPNNVVSSASIVNLTKDSKNTRIFVYMSVAYGANQSLAKELMIKAANMHPHVVKDGTEPMPGTRLTNFLDSGIEYRLSCVVDDFDSSAHYAGQIREIIFKLFKDNDVEIPYNRLEVTMLEPCDGKKKETDPTDD